MDGARPHGAIGLFQAGLDGVRDDAELAARLDQMLLHANVGNVQVLDRRAGVPLPPAPVMAGARPDGAIGLFEAGPDGARDTAELAEQLAQMQAFANVGNVLLLDRRAKAEARHVSRMQKARDGAAPKPAAPAPPARWAASLRTAAARPPRRSAGVPRAVRRGATRSFPCRPKLRAIRRSAEPARLPTGEEQERKELEDALRESAAEVCRESERERDERAEREKVRE